MGDKTNIYTMLDDDIGPFQIDCDQESSRSPGCSIPYQDAIHLLNGHDGKRFEGVKNMISKMSLSDLKLITDFCISLERIRR